MYITLSVATSADHYIDDMTSERLRLSTPGDWAEVYRLRSESDAILIGGETLRRDDPTLGLKPPQEVEPMRVIVSGRGDISTDMKIFQRGRGRIVIFSEIERAELEGIAEVITAKTIDIPFIITELEKRSIKRLFVEGGAKIHKMFLDSKLVTELRLAVNPTIVVADNTAPIFPRPEWLDSSPCREEMFDEMRVTTYLLRQDLQPTQHDREMMVRALEISRNSPPKDSCYRVGSLIETLRGETFTGYTLETAPTHHAEQAAMHKAIEAGAELKGATIYASMEPCSTRSSEPLSCSELIIKHGIKRVVFALYEPSHFVTCHGAENLRRAAVETIHLSDFEEEVYQINSHVLSMVK